MYLLLDDEHVDADIDEATEFVDKVLVMKAKAAKCLSALAQPRAQSAESFSTSTGSSYTDVVRPKLPELVLPNFSSQACGWSSSWEQFEIAVGSTALPPVRKFAYLKSALKREAATCIEGLSLTSEHYKTGCELLKQHFDHPELIILSHMRGLLNLECKAGTGNLRKLLDNLMKHVRSNEALKINGDSHGVFLIPITLLKLPNDVHLEWARESVGKESNLSHLLNFICLEIEC